MKKSLEFMDKVLSWLIGIGYGAESIEREIKSFKSFIPDARVFVDVGANKGLYSEALIKQFQNISKIYLFEPSKTNFDILIQKFKLNNNNMFSLNNLGLADINSISILYSNEAGSGLAGLSKRNLDHFGIDFDFQEEINIVRFDEYWLTLNNLEIIDLFKIDVEGHELRVLEGIGSFINKIKVIQFEFGGCNIDTKTYFQDFWYFFEDKNFDIYRITPLGPMKITKYKESYERFETTNYFCVNNNLMFV
jgi:FkbM family methyltransferase